MYYENVKQELLTNPRKHLVTGCAGLIGSNLLETLLKLNLRDINITFVNELAIIFNKLNIDTTAVLEAAICNNQNIKGKDLKIRINKMKTEGLVPKKDASRLHAIRFMGNDAAHEIKKANKNSVHLALEIIEHLLTSVYIFEGLSYDKLDTSIDDFQILLKVLQKNIHQFETTEIVTLKKWLGNHNRRIIDDTILNTLENELTSYITDGKFDNVSLETIINSDGTQTQGYRIMRGLA